jgi:predicted DsbA family dithiol-disulfide isomerase
VDEKPVRVAHFSDVLCVWAYVSEVRIDELRGEFGGRVEVAHHVCSVFGNTRSKLVEGWADRGGMEGYAAHVQSVVEGFEHASIHPRTWAKVRPASSLPCHLDVMAVRILARQERVPARTVRRLLRAYRVAFFCDARDVSAAGVRHELLVELGLDTEALAAVRVLHDSGEAHAELAGDLALARRLDVRVSPTLVFNQGRQHLNGNVGYRIIEANVRELLERPEVAHSWC